MVAFFQYTNGKKKTVCNVVDCVYRSESGLVVLKTQAKGVRTITLVHIPLDRLDYYELDMQEEKR